MSPEEMEAENVHHAIQLLTNVAGLDADEHGLATPQRFVAMLAEMTACSVDRATSDHLAECIKWKQFPAASEEMVIVAGIPFVSLCNHHVIPFHGHVHIAYVPGKDNAGLSKFARVVGHFSRRLQVQERMTAEIADYLERKLTPKGVGVVVEAEHMCMAFRGVRSMGTETTTAAMRGVFADHARTAKAEFMSTLDRRK